MSSLRSRSGGKSMTASSDDRTGPVGTGLFHQFDQIRLLAAITRKSTVTGSLDPSRSIFRSCRPKELDLHCRRHAFRSRRERECRRARARSCQFAACCLREGARLVAEHLASNSRSGSPPQLTPTNGFRLRLPC